MVRPLYDLWYGDVVKEEAELRKAYAAIYTSALSKLTQATGELTEGLAAADLGYLKTIERLELEIAGLRVKISAVRSSPPVSLANFRQTLPATSSHDNCRSLDGERQILQEEKIGLTSYITELENFIKRTLEQREQNRGVPAGKIVSTSSNNRLQRSFV